MIKSYAHQPSSIIPFPVISQIAKKIPIVQPRFLLLFMVPLWLTPLAMAPQIVRAETARVNLAFDRLPDENYETVLRRAEAVARAAAQRSFDKDILVTDVSIIVSVQNFGAIAPVLTLEVTRPQWRKRPDAQRWVTYFKTARSLLFLEPKPATANPAQVTNQNPTVQPTTPSPGTQRQRR